MGKSEEVDGEKDDVKENTKKRAFLGGMKIPKRFKKSSKKKEDVVAEDIVAEEEIVEKTKKKRRKKKAAKKLDDDRDSLYSSAHSITNVMPDETEKEKDGPDEDEHVSE